MRKYALISSDEPRLRWETVLEVLAVRTFRRLFAAQLVALVGTGLLTVALGLLAYDIAGSDAGAVLGTASAIKMVAYVVVAPVMSAVAASVPRKVLLVAADGVRASIAVTLPFVDQVWQIYGLIFVLQAASATFTPAFQSIIPSVCPRKTTTRGRCRCRGWPMTWSRWPVR